MVPMPSCLESSMLVTYLFEIALATVEVACLAALSSLVLAAAKDASTLLLVRDGLR